MYIRIYIDRYHCLCMHIAGMKACSSFTGAVGGEACGSILFSALHFSVRVMKDFLQSNQHSIGP